VRDEVFSLMKTNRSGPWNKHLESLLRKSVLLFLLTEAYSLASALLIAWVFPQNPPLSITLIVFTFLAFIVALSVRMMLPNWGLLLPAGFSAGLVLIGIFTFSFFSTQPNSIQNLGLPWSYGPLAGWVTLVLCVGWSWVILGVGRRTAKKTIGQSSARGVATRKPDLLPGSKKSLPVTMKPVTKTRPGQLTLAKSATQRTNKQASLSLQKGISSANKAQGNTLERPARPVVLKMGSSKAIQKSGSRMPKSDSVESPIHKWVNRVKSLLTGSSARQPSHLVASRPGVNNHMVKDVKTKSRRLVWLRRKPHIHLSAAEDHRCPYCLEPVIRDDPRGIKVCEKCHTLHHADCWAVTGTCQVPHLN
jgi:hypothetical protein